MICKACIRRCACSLAGRITPIPKFLNKSLLLPMKTLFTVLLLAGCCAPIAPAASVYTSRLPDARAVYFTPDRFAVHGDGVADDTAALQEAINKVQETT